LAEASRGHICLDLAQRGFIFRKISLRLIQSGFERPRVYGEQWSSFLTKSPRKGDVGDLARDLCFTEIVEYASTLPITCTSTGTFFCVDTATVTGTSPPPPFFPPPFPRGSADAAEVAPELPQADKRRVRGP